MYQLEELSYDRIPQFSKRDKAYQLGDENLRPFYKHEMVMESFEKIIENRKGFEIDRDMLVQQLMEQYADVPTSILTSKNIEALRLPDTYTVVTAHQPSLLTGPLYFIYKICSAIALAQKINEELIEYYIVPVLVMGGEDHDFDEIATVNMFGSSYTWSTDQVGPTGRMSHDGLRAVLDDVLERLGGGEHAQLMKNMIWESLEHSSTYGEFMFLFVDQLFREYGLVIINFDNPVFKEKLLPYVIYDVSDGDPSMAVNRDQRALEKAGFQAQAHVRDVNIFWIDGNRHRVILEEDGTYTIGEETMSKDEVIARIKSSPGSVSPNVIMRPVFQELILPNLAYIGGGGELAYWMERKSLFEGWDLPFPMLVRRDSVMILDKKTNQWLDKNKMSYIDLFHREEQVIGKYAHSQAEVDLNLHSEKQLIQSVFETIRDLADKVDPTLSKTVLSEAAKADKSISYLENKLLKAEKNKNEVAINKLKNLKSRYFPGNDGLQERHDNFIPYFLKHGPSWFDELLKHLDPLNRNFKVLLEY